MIFLKIGEQPFPFAFGMAGIRRFEQNTGRAIGSLFAIFKDGEVDEVDITKVLFSDLLLVIACGLETGARKSGNAKSFTVDDVADLLDDSGNIMGTIVEAMQELANSFTVLNNAQPQEGKKKEVAATP